MKKKCIIIHGSTGVGKSDAAVRLALQYGGHIINGDVGQFYEPLTIGTAKPDWRHEQVPHHFFDLIETPHNYTVVEYRALVLAKMEELWAQGILPIIVGGSGFYIRSLFFPPCEEAQTTEIALDDACSADAEQEVSWDVLYEQDPKRAASINPHDTYRIGRALELLRTGTTPSTRAPEYKSLGCDVLMVWLERDRAELYDRINERVYQMMQLGWLQEAQALIGTAWEPYLINKKIIGYDLLITYSKQDSEQTLEAVIATIAQKTRNYAKRQHTFWRMFKKTIMPHMQAPSHVVEISLSAQDSYTSLATVVDRFIKETV